MANKAARDGSVVWIELKGGLRTVVDEADYWKVSGHNWSAFHSSRSRDGQYYVHSWKIMNGRRVTIYLHRIIMDAPRGVYVDHINHDPLDNRRANLRLCSNQENNVNRDGAYRSSATGLRGISVHQCWAMVKGERAKSGKMYVFRCHSVSCKVAKYFPWTADGLEAAKVYAIGHHGVMES